MGRCMTGKINNVKNILQTVYTLLIKLFYILHNKLNHKLCLGEEMQFACGQKVMVRSPVEERYMNARIISFFYLTDDDVSYLRKRHPQWANVQRGDRAFYYSLLGVEENDNNIRFDPRIFVIGYDDVYLCTR